VKTFSLVILDSNGRQEFGNLTSFVGEDKSGSFGILAGHARMITSLVIGLARFRTGEDDWNYAALPGAILYFNRDVLSLSTRQCLVGKDYAIISTALKEQLLGEEEKLRTMKESLHRMEEEVLRRLWEIRRREA
jgi:F-type H+-transporting ATPase subunit epsilon